MKRDTVNYLAVGTFVLLMLGALLAALFMITGRSGPTDRYYVLYDNVVGLKLGTPVLYQGYPVGQVESITPEREHGQMRYHIDLSVQQGWAIPSDSVARVVSSGLLSTVSIDIHEGRAQTVLEPGSRIQGEEGGDLFAAINDVAVDLRAIMKNNIRPLIDNLDKRITRIADLVESTAPQVLENVRQLSVKLNASADMVQDILDRENRDNLREFLANLERISENFMALSRDVQQTRAKVDVTLSGLDGLVRENREGIRTSVADLRASLHVVSESVGTIAHNLEGTSRNLNEFSRQIRQNPGLLLSGSPPRDRTGLNP